MLVIVVKRDKVILFFLVWINFFGSNFAQNTWIRSESNNIFEVSDVIINQENIFFISTKNTHHIFSSADSSTNWNEVPINTFDKFLPHYKNKYFKLLGGRELYFGFCGGDCNRFQYHNSEFTNYSGLSSSFTDLKFDNEENVFWVSSAGVFNTNQDWKANFSDAIVSFPDYSLLNSFFYKSDNNYVVSKHFEDSAKIYKLNSKTKESKLFSAFKVDIGANDIFINSSGIIFYKVVKFGKQVLYCSSRINPYNYSECVVDSNAQISQFYFYFINSNNQIFILTDKGVYLNEGTNQFWTKCYKLSMNFPIQIYNTSGFDLDKYYYFKDSLNAIISYGDNCGRSSVYTFTTKFQFWKPVDLNLNRDNFTSIKKNIKGRLYAFRPCENLTNHNYLVSDNNGKDWETLYINGEPVSSIGINKFGEAIAIAYKYFYINNSDQDTWLLTKPPSTNDKDMHFQQFYSNKGDLFLTGINENIKGGPKHYLFHSADGGYTWNEVSAFITSSHDPLADFEIFVDNNNNWLVYSEQLSFIPTSILLSKDFGKTWEVDQRFKDFEFVKAIQQLSDNRYLISGKYKTKIYGSYISNSFGGFDLLSNYFEAYPSKLYLQSDTSLFGFSAWPNGSPIPFTSTDIGKSIHEDESGLIPEVLDYRYIQSAILSPGQKTVLNLAYDGIYTSRGDIFSNVVDKYTKILQRYLFFQNNSTITLSKIDGTEFKKGELFRIYNTMGQLVTKDELLKRNGEIDISPFLQGIYFLEISSSNNQTECLKFVKQN